MMIIGLPSEAVGLKLYRIDRKGQLIGCEAIKFLGGVKAIETTLLRAKISGRVEVDGKIVDHFADVLDDEQSIIETIALDAKSYSALKNRWMRCKTEPTQ